MSVGLLPHLALLKVVLCEHACTRSGLSGAEQRRDTLDGRWGKRQKFSAADVSPHTTPLSNFGDTNQANEYESETCVILLDLPGIYLFTRYRYRI